ncbi:MAG: pyruvate kinase, partial [Nanoarchaeota archaeon]|nr:pyruvate kinase [Nanoarchaeota archaeon]
MESFTKIVATLGPACDTVEGIEKLRKAGLNVARLNFSHGSHDYFRKVIANIRKVDTNIAILLDTKGPEIRTGDYESGSLTLDLHEKILLSNKPMKEKHILIQYPHLLTVSEGTEILIDDGLVEVRVLKVEKDHLVARVENSAVLGSRKTVTIRNHQTKIPFLSQKDKEDIEFGIEQNLDFIAASFVREVEDLEQIEAILKKHNSSIKIISKIEHPRAIENLDKIIEKSFGIMVARGDLGVELPAEKVPEYQSYIIEKCNFFGKPVIVATQMLESMKSEPRPTRAEVADVANAVREGADAVMLSGETANGKHPHKAVQTMNRIAHEYQDKIRV